jgi:hypothetical protein
MVRQPTAVVDCREPLVVAAAATEVDNFADGLWLAPLGSLLESIAPIATMSTPDLALRLAGAAAALRDSLGLHPSATERERLETWVSEARRRLGDAGGTAASARGRSDTASD